MTARRLEVRYTIHFPDGDTSGPRYEIMTERRFMRMLDDYERIGWRLEYKTEWLG